MKALVTGGNGFVARYLIPLLVREGYRVLNVDRRNGHDLRDPKTADLIRRFHPDTVFHLAAVHYVPYCRSHPVETVEHNVIGTQRLLAALDWFANDIVMASSAAVYGFGPEPFDESAPLAPVDVYGYTKLTCEVLLRDHCERHGTHGVSARLFNVIGEGDHTDHVLPRILSGATQLGSPYPKRDYIGAEDVAEALLWLRDAPAAVYNVGTGQATSVSELVEMTGRKVRFGEGRLLDGDLLSDPSRLKALGWRPADTASVVRTMFQKRKVAT